MTVKELRNILFHVENQELTVRELRGILFDINLQDSEITESEIARITRTNKEE